MKEIDRGVSGDSYMDFYTPSDFAKIALYFCAEYGHFFCNNQYNISRDYLDLFLFILVENGALTIETQERVYTASSGEIVLLDCRHPHKYYCKERVEFLWFHFKGNSSDTYSKLLCAQHGITFPGNERIERNFKEIIQTLQAEIVNEHQISFLISGIFCYLASVTQNAIAVEGFLRPATDYIRHHYNEAISLEQLSTQCSVSVPHLIRSFKKYLNCTPHEYLLAYRLRQAKQILVGSSASIEQIAESCGFNSASHFTRAFRANTSLTPTEFRKLKF